MCGCGVVRKYTIIQKTFQYTIMKKDIPIYQYTISCLGIIIVKGWQRTLLCECWCCVLVAAMHENSPFFCPNTCTDFAAPRVMSGEMLHQMLMHHLVCLVKL